MTSYVIHDYELEGIIQAAGDEVRGAFGKGNMEKAANQLEALEMIVEAREVPNWATHFYAFIPGNEIEESGIPLSKIVRIPI